jgi:hypothetical protein
MPAHEHTPIPGASEFLQGLLLTLALMAVAPAAADEPPTVLLSEVLRVQSRHLTTVDSNAGAVTLFATSIGPSVGLRDAAGTLGAKGLPAKLVKELGVEDLSRSAQQLVSALAVWQLAESVGHAAQNPSSVEATPLPDLPPSRADWLKTNSQVGSLPALLELLDANGQPDHADRTALALAAGPVAFEANQRAITAWWELFGWKDRVRLARGRARLCGTWQWVIHNHQQHHQEQKLSLIFPPPGPDRPVASGLVETVVLGENVYLRWEINGQVQEDSLQFSKEGQRLEGTFVNSQGGWGSITGKRTADCRP